MLMNFELPNLSDDVEITTLKEDRRDTIETGVEHKRRWHAASNRNSKYIAQCDDLTTKLTEATDKLATHDEEVAKYKKAVGHWMKKSERLVEAAKTHTDCYHHAPSIHRMQRALDNLTQLKEEHADLRREYEMSQETNSSLSEINNVRLEKIQELDHEICVLQTEHAEAVENWRIAQDASDEYQRIFTSAKDARDEYERRWHTAQTRTDKYNAENTKLRAEIKQLKESIREHDQSTDMLQLTNKLNTHIDDLNDTLKGREQQIANQRTLCENLRSKISELEEELAEVRKTKKAQKHTIEKLKTANHECETYLSSFRSSARAKQYDAAIEENNELKTKLSNLNAQIERMKQNCTNYESNDFLSTQIATTEKERDDALSECANIKKNNAGLRRELKDANSKIWHTNVDNENADRRIEELEKRLEIIDAHGRKLLEAAHPTPPLT